eukprot:scaffold27594_cov48-Attheya_sp.AAC.7
MNLGTLGETQDFGRRFVGGIGNGPFRGRKRQVVGWHGNGRDGIKAIAHGCDCHTPFATNDQCVLSRSNSRCRQGSLRSKQNQRSTTGTATTTATTGRRGRRIEG